MAALFVALTVAAQSNLTGIVKDTKGEPVPFATVTLLTGDSAYVIGTTTDETGKYVLTNDAAAALLRASCVGYVTSTIPKSDNAVITLSEDAVVLEGVEVVSMRQLVQSLPDRLAYNVEADAESKTSSVIDMLRKVPLVSVDHEDNVRVNGTTNFKFYRNGHEDPTISANPQAVLRSMPANSIKRIEVITDPGAKYDAEGVTAIINIVTIENNRLGSFNGTVELSANTLGNFTPSLFFTAQKNKFAISFDGWGSFRRDKSFQDGNIGMPESGIAYKTDLTSRNKLFVPGAAINMSYEFDTLNLLTSSIIAYYADIRTKGDTHTDVYDTDGNLISRYDQNQDGSKISAIYVTGRLDYEHRTHRPDELLTLSYMYNTDVNKSRQLNTLSNLYNPMFDYTKTDTWSRVPASEHTFQADYQRRLWRHNKLETGAKYILRLNRSHNINTYEGAPELDVDLRFRHTTHVAAAYFSWLYEIGKLSLRAGLRYEFSRMKVAYPDGEEAGYSSNLNDWVPSASVNWKIDDFRNLRFSFATTINRPDISYLNPAVTMTTITVNSGNPNLGSSHTNGFTLNYQQVGNKVTFNLSPSVEFSNNMIGDYTYAYDNKIYSTYSNHIRHTAFTFNAMVQWMVTKTTTWMVSGSVFYHRYRNPSLDLTNDGFSGYLYTQLSQKLPWQLLASANMFWWGIGDMPFNVYNVVSSPLPSLSLSLSRSFFDDRLNVRLKFDNILSKYYKYEISTVQGNYTKEGTNRSVGRSIGITLSYRFGSGNARVKRTATTIENNDVVGGSDNTSTSTSVSPN